MLRINSISICQGPINGEPGAGHQNILTSRCNRRDAQVQSMGTTTAQNYILQYANQKGIVKIKMTMENQVQV